MATQRRSFQDTLFIGQHWKHQFSDDMVKILQIHRKDRQVLVQYVNGEDLGDTEYKYFNILRMYWTPKEILL